MCITLTLGNIISTKAGRYEKMYNLSLKFNELVQYRSIKSSADILILNNCSSKTTLCKH